MSSWINDKSAEGEDVVVAGAFRERLRSLLYPSLADMGRRNEAAFVWVVVLIAAGGSLATLVIALFASWALISLILERFPFRFGPSDSAVVFSSIAFFAVLAGTNFPVAETPEALLTTLKLMPFLIPLLLISRMRLTPPDRILPLIFKGAAIGGCLLVPLLMAERLMIFLYAPEGTRSAGLSGNPGPFALTCVLIAGLALLHLSRRNAMGANLLALAGSAGASLGVLLSGMRGTWPALPVVVLIALIARRRDIAWQWRRATVEERRLLGVWLVVAAVCAGSLALPLVGDRIALVASDLTLLVSSPEAATSLNVRRNIYNAALAAWAERPWTGYGISGRWEAIRPHLETADFGGLGFSHLHNVFLTVAVDAGLLGLAALLFVIIAPLWTAWRARFDAFGAERLGFALVLVSAFLVPGLTNLMFFHDILDSVWVFLATSLCASVPLRGRRNMAR